MTTKTELFQPLRIRPLSEGTPLIDVATLDVCAPELTALPDTRRFMAGGEMGFFPNAGAMTPDVPLQNMSSSQFTSVYRDRNGLQYEQVTTNPLLGEQRTSRQLHLCRAERPDATRNYAVYAYDPLEHPVLNHRPENPAAVRTVPIHLRDGEIVRVVNECRINPADYGVTQSDTLPESFLSIKPDQVSVNGYADCISGLVSLSEERRGQIADAFRTVVGAETNQAWSLWWQRNWGAVFQGAAALLGVAGLGATVYYFRKMKQISVEAAVAAARATQQDAKPREVTSEATAREILNELGEDMLERARRGGYAPYVEPRGSSRIARLYDSLHTNNAAMLWNAGGGKTALAEGLAQHIAGLPEDRRVMYNIDITRFEAGTMYRGTYARNVTELQSAIEFLRGQGYEVTIFIDEVAQRGAESGHMDEGQAVKVLNALKPYLAKTNGFLIAAVREEWDRTLGNDPALSRRFDNFDAPAYTESQVREILLDPRLRQYFTGQYGQGRIRWSDGAVDTILELTRSFYPGEPLISASAKVARSIVGVRASDPQGQVEVTADQVYERFAASKNWTVPELRQRLDLIRRLVNLRDAYQRQANLNMLAGRPQDPVRLSEGRAQEVVHRWAGLPEADRDIYRRFSWGDGVGEYPRSFIESAFPPPQAQPPVPPRPVAPAPGNGAGAPRVVRTGWEEVLTHRINDRVVADALIALHQPGLFEYYRDQLSPLSGVVTNMSELLRRIPPEVQERVLQWSTREMGRPVAQIPERVVFEMVVRSAEGRGAFTDGDATARERMAVRFEREVRDRSGIERTERGPEIDRAERERQRGRRRAPVAGRP